MAIMEIKDLRIGMEIYHKAIYNYKEELTIVGIDESGIEVEGDLSGGTHNVIQKCRLPFEGTSTIYNYGYKLQCREYLRRTKKFMNDHYRNNASDVLTMTIESLLIMVDRLTTDSDLNKGL